MPSRTLVLAVLTALVAAVAASPAPAADDYNLPRQYSSQQGQDGWRYLYGNSASGPSLAVWDNTVSPWGTRPTPSWNGSPRYYYIGGRPIENWKASSAGGDQIIQTGEHADATVSWTAPRAGTVRIRGMINTAGEVPSCCDPYPDDGVWFSIWKNSSRLTEEAHVFHGTTAADRVPDTELFSSASVAAGDRIYFYLRRGEWQDADYMYYSFSVSYAAAPDLTAPQTTHAVSGGKLTLAATDDKSGVATTEYLPNVANAVWTKYTGPVTVPAGVDRYLYRSLDNIGNLEAYHQVAVTPGQDDGNPPPPEDPNDEQGGGPPDASSGCAKPTVSFWLVDALASCFTQQGDDWVAQGRVRINGLDIVPVGAAKIHINTQDKRLRSTGTVAVRIGNIELYRGTLDWSLDRPAFELNVAGGAEVKGFTITGKAAFSIVDGGIKVAVEVGLPTIPGLPTNITGGVTLRATNAEGLRLDGLKLELGQLPIRGLFFNGASLEYSRTDDGKDRWSGEVTAVLPIGSAVEVMGGMTLITPPWQVEAIRGHVDNLNKPVYGPVFLQKIGIEVTFLPSIKLAGTIGLSAGPDVLGAKALGVEGTLEVALPFGSEPVVVTAKGEVQVVILTLAEGEIVWRVPGDVTFKGELDYGALIAGLKMTANGWINSSSFLAEGSGQMYVDLYFGRANFGEASALISSKGLASCAGSSVWTPFGSYTISVGFGLSWGGSLSVKASGCNVGDYRPATSRRTVARQSTPAPVQVPAGLDQVTIGATGADAPPVVTLTTPSGEVIDPETQGGSGTIDHGAWMAIREPDTKTTYFLVANPRAGTWVVTPAAGQAVTEVGLARSLPAATIKASVRKAKGRHRLAWRFRAAAGRTVRFYERTGRSVRQIARTAKGSGRVVFRPLDDGSRGVRRIEALVEQRGMPQERVTVARYTGPAPRVPRAPKVRLRRKGTRALARWRAVPRILRYEVRYKVTDGRNRFVARKPGQRRLAIARVNRGERVTVSVRAVGTNGIKGSARTVTMRR